MQTLWQIIKTNGSLVSLLIGNRHHLAVTSLSNWHIVECNMLVCVEADWPYRGTHLHNPHQHQPSGSSHVTGSAG